MGVVVLATRSPSLTIQRYHFLSLVTSVLILALTFLMDFLSGMPAFFLPNSVILLLYIFNAGLSHSLRLKYFQSGTLLVAFLLYAVYISPHSAVHLSQIWNIQLNILISLLIGFLFERYKRQHFMQRVELLQAQSKIEALDNLKTKLISVLSHDLSSPLNNLRGLMQLKDDGAITEEGFSQYSSKVRKSMENVMDMMQNLVHWSTSQLNGIKPSQNQIDIKQTINEIIEIQENAIKSKNLKVLNLAENNPNLLLDREILKIVIRNFLTNSIKFSEAGSQITISSETKAHTYTLSVQDTGIGMTPEEIANLFQTKKVSRPGTSNEGGSGIGLIITKEFVEMMNGTIAAQSEVGKGSTLSVTFQLA